MKRTLVRHKRGPSPDVIAILVDAGLLEPLPDGSVRILQPERWFALFDAAVEVDAWDG